MTFHWIRLARLARHSEFRPPPHRRLAAPGLTGHRRAGPVGRRRPGGLRSAQCTGE